MAACNCFVRSWPAQHGVSGRVVLLSEIKFRIGDLGGNVKLEVPCKDAACTVGLNQLSVARNPDKPTQNKFKNKQRLLYNEENKDNEADKVQSSCTMS